MAGAETACVPARAGTILGITRSLASPAYRRLERIRTLAEARRPGPPGRLSRHPRDERLDPGSRRARGSDRRRDQRHRRDRDALGREARRPCRPGRQQRGGGAAGRLREGTARRTRSRADGSLLLTDALGSVLATHPPTAAHPPTLADLLGEAQPLTLFADRAGVMTIRLATGEDGIATVRALPASAGQVAIVQPLSSVLAGVDRLQDPRAGIASRRRSRRARRDRACLFHAVEPRACRERSLREGARPHRFRP